MPIVLPERNRNPLDAVVAQIMQTMQQEDAEKRRLEQNESQFNRQMQAQTRVDDAQIGTLGAQKASADATRVNTVFDMMSKQAQVGAAPYVDRIKLAKDEGDLGRAKQIAAEAEAAFRGRPEYGEVYRLVGAWMTMDTSGVPLKSEQTAANVAEYSRGMTEQAKGGGGSLEARNLTFSLAHPKNEQISAQALPVYAAGAAGQAQTGEEIAGGIRPGAEAELTAKTTLATNAASNASAERIAAADRAATGQREATKASEAEGATAVGTARKGAEQSAEIMRLVDSLIGNEEAGIPEHPGFRGAVGAKNILAQPGIGPFQKDEPFAYSDEAAAKKSIQQLIAIATIPQMQVMKGLGQQSDREFQNVQASATALSTDIPEAAFKAEALRLRNNAAALMDRYERLKRTADKHFGGNINQAAAYIRSHGGEL